MRSYRVHACTPEVNGKIPYLVLSLCGAQRVSIDMCGMQGTAAKSNDAVALTLEALYDLLQGKPIKISRKDGSIRLCPEGPQLLIQKDGSMTTHRVWMAELALAWNMLAGFDAMPLSTRWSTQ
jgi:hypothetical protein